MESIPGPFLKTRQTDSLREQSLLHRMLKNSVDMSDSHKSFTSLYSQPSENKENDRNQQTDRNECNLCQLTGKKFQTKCMECHMCHTRFCRDCLGFSAKECSFIHERQVVLWLSKVCSEKHTFSLETKNCHKELFQHTLQDMMLKLAKIENDIQLKMSKTEVVGVVKQVLSQEGTREQQSSTIDNYIEKRRIQKNIIPQSLQTERN